MRQNDRRTYTVAEAAKLLGICRTSVYRAARRGQLAAIRVGGRVLILRDELERRLGHPL